MERLSLPDGLFKHKTKFVVKQSVAYCTSAFIKLFKVVPSSGAARLSAARGPR